VIDEGWYMQNPFAGKMEAQKDLWDANGILIRRSIASSAGGRGFKPLADWVHSKGPQVSHSHSARGSIAKW